ncbi:MAG: hypothetical protein IT380_18040 [Myxococcales bacterium]|nr:hypothetical protein [Myxococcales bacterium]
MRDLRSLALALAACGLCGCASISNVQTADTLGKGNIQVGIEPGLWGAAGQGGAAFLPHVDASVRYGVAERVDLGVRGGSSFLEFQSKFLLTTPGDPNFALSIAPTIGGVILFGVGSTSGGSASGGGGILNIGLPVLFGIKTSGGSEFVIGPRVQNLVFFGGSGVNTSSGSGSGYLLGLGGSLGFFWRIADNFGLLPEVSAVYPVLGAASNVAGGLQGAGAGGALMQFKLGVIIGGGRKPGQGNPDLREAPPSPPPMPPSDVPPPPPPPPP